MFYEVFAIKLHASQTSELGVSTARVLYPY